MTHTYSRGCFKLIFRKCLPIYTSYPPCCEHTQGHTYTFFITIARLLALSHRRTILQHVYPYAPSPFRSVFRTSMPFFPSYFPSFSSYPFSSTSFFFAPSHILLSLSHFSRLRFSFSSFPHILSSIFLHCISSSHFSSFRFLLFLFLIPLSLSLLFNFIFHSSVIFFSPFPLLPFNISSLFRLLSSLIHSFHFIFLFPRNFFFLFDFPIIFSLHFSHFSSSLLSFFSLTHLSRSTA